MHLKNICPIIATSILTTCFTYANTNDPATSVCNSAINPPGMPLTRNGWDFQVSADALLWQLQEDGLFYAIESNQNLPVGLGRVKQKYNWGFRLGLDWTIPHDNWDIAATWTHLITNRQGSYAAQAGNRLIAADLIADAPSLLTASSKYHNRLDQICLNTGREFFISKWVTLRPFVGLRTDWLNQRIRSSYVGTTENPTIVRQAQKEIKWWGIGIESGLNTQWSFCGGFSIYGNIATAIEYGLQKLQVVETAATPATFRDSYHVCRPIIDLQLGIGWDYNFCNDGIHLGWKLGWENHVYFDQSYTNFGPITLIKGNLTYQGWTLHLNLDF